MRYVYYGFIILYVIYTFSLGLISANLIPGHFVFSNKSNSMSPAITTGDLIVVRPMSSYQVGDIVSYYSIVNYRQTIVTHRIMTIGGNVYLTKGDANEAYDSIILPRLIIGKVVLVIPYLGYFIGTAKSTFGVLFTILLPASIIIIYEGYSLAQALQRKR